MAFSKKGSRRIAVEQQRYVYKVGRIRVTSDWRAARRGELNDAFLNTARRYGLGEVADASLTIAVQAEADAASSMFVQIRSVVVDGFLGFEQALSVTPALVEAIIRHGLDHGWRPHDKGDVRVDILEHRDNDHDAVLFLVPDTAPRHGDGGALTPLLKVDMSRDEEPT